jgi:ribosomal protein L7/L12
VILKDLKQEQADEFKGKLEELGAIIELVQYR